VPAGIAGNNHVGRPLVCYKTRIDMISVLTYEQIFFISQVCQRVTKRQPFALIGAQEAALSFKAVGDLGENQSISRPANMRTRFLKATSY